MHPLRKIVSGHQYPHTHYGLAEMLSEMRHITGNEEVSARGNGSHKNGNIL